MIKLEYTEYTTIQKDMSISIKQPFLTGFSDRAFEMVGLVEDTIITILRSGISMRRIPLVSPEACLIEFCRTHKNVTEISPKEFMEGLIDRQNKIQNSIEVLRNSLQNTKGKRVRRANEISRTE